MQARLRGSSDTVANYAVCFVLIAQQEWRLTTQGRRNQGLGGQFCSAVDL